MNGPSSSGVAQSAMSPIDMLIMAVPGKPGEDYPILATVPETAFTCEGRTEGGYYADVSAVHVLLSIYPDFIQISSRFYPEFIQMISRFYPDFILILSRTWTGL